jgi:hypothetical protein
MATWSSGMILASGARVPGSIPVAALFAVNALSCGCVRQAHCADVLGHDPAMKQPRGLASWLRMCGFWVQVPGWVGVGGGGWGGRRRRRKREAENGGLQGERVGQIFEEVAHTQSLRWIVELAHIGNACRIVGMLAACIIPFGGFGSGLLLNSYCQVLLAYAGKISCPHRNPPFRHTLCADHDPGRTRTCNPRICRPTPYPLGHGAA